MALVIMTERPEEKGEGKHDVSLRSPCLPNFEH